MHFQFVLFIEVHFMFQLFLLKELIWFQLFVELMGPVTVLLKQVIFKQGFNSYFMPIMQQFH
jgi:hypothetical protein